MNKSFYAIIPSNVRYSKNIPDGAKLLYGEITALCNEKGYCWASNSYFAELYSNSIDTISRWVNLLKKEGFIKVVIDIEKGNLRQIYLSAEMPKVSAKIKTPIRKNADSSPQKYSDPIRKNAEHNNTVNIIDNITNKIDSDFLKNNSKKEKPNKGSSLDLSEYQKEFVVVWNNWKTYKKEKHKFTFLNAESEKRSIQELLNLANKDYKKCEAIVNQSIDNGWKGLFDVKQTTQQKAIETKANIVSDEEMKILFFTDNEQYKRQLLINAVSRDSIK